MTESAEKGIPQREIKGRCLDTPVDTYLREMTLVNHVIQCITCGFLEGEPQAHSLISYGAPASVDGDLITSTTGFQMATAQVALPQTKASADATCSKSNMLECHFLQTHQSNNSGIL